MKGDALGLARIFAMPALAGIASAIGLVAGLVGDGWWDAVSWAGLGLAVALCGWYALARRSKPPSR